MKVIESIKIRKSTVTEREKAIIKFNNLAILLHGKKSIEPDPTTWLLIKDDVLKAGYVLEEEDYLKVRKVVVSLQCSNN